VYKQDNSTLARKNAGSMPTLRFSYKCSKFECQSMWPLGTKLLVVDDFVVGVDGPISVSVQESETRQPLCSHGRLHIGLNPPHSTKRTLRSCCRHGHRDKGGEDGRNFRIQFFIGATKFILQSGWFVFWVNVRPLCFPSHNLTVKHSSLR